MSLVAIITPNGINRLTAVNGGGLAAGKGVAISTNATSIGKNELFTLVCVDYENSKFALQTDKGNFVTFVKSGGIGGPNSSESPLHTDAKWDGPWEKFKLVFQKGNGKVAIQTPNGKNYLSVVNGGGVGGPNTTPIHTDATWAKSWEIFTFKLLNEPAQTDPPAETALSFESQNLSEPDGSYMNNRTNVGWTGVYQVQLKNVSKRTVEIKELKLIDILEGLKGKSQYDPGYFKLNGKMTISGSKKLVPGADLQIVIPVKRTKAYKAEGNGITSNFKVEYEYIATSEFSELSPLASQ